MANVSLNQALWVFGWFPLATLILLLLLIARFYAQFSGLRTYYALYMIPLVLFGASAVRYANVNQNAGDLFGDALAAVAGVVLTVLSLFLLHMMVGRR